MSGAKNVEVGPGEFPYLSGISTYRIENSFENGKEYYFALTATYEDGGSSNYTEIVSAIPADTEAPKMVEGVVASANSNWFNIITQVDASYNSEEDNGDVEFRWKVDPASGSDWLGGNYADVKDRIEKIRLFYGTTEGQNYTNFLSIDGVDALSLGKTLSLNDISVDTMYYYVVVDYFDDGGSSLFSNEQSVTVDRKEGFKVVADTLSNLVNIMDSINVSWQANTDDTEYYNIYYGIVYGFYGGEKKVSGRTNTSLTFPVSNSDGMYFIKVNAYDEADNQSDDSDVILLIPSKSDSTFQNALTNVGFEEGKVGGVPSGWGKSDGQAGVSVGITDVSSFAGDQSFRIMQESNLPYPGKCGIEARDKVPPEYRHYNSKFTFSNISGTNYCTWSSTPDCNKGGLCQAKEGENLLWPFRNRVMWGNFNYNVSNLDWNVGEEYFIAFFYKGNLAASIRPRMCYSLGWCSQTRNSIGGSCAMYGSPWTLCSANPSRCCRYPTQTDSYKSISFGNIPAGDYNSGPYGGWNLYFNTFTYTAKMEENRNNSGNTRNVIGLTIGYNNTGPTGTDFYVDDFMIAQKVK